MRKIGGPLIVALTVLAVPQLASAKEVTSVQLCGASGCAAIPKAKARSFYAHPDEQASRVSAPPAGAYYRLRLGVGEGDETLATVEADALANGLAMRSSDGAWTALSPAQRSVLEDIRVSPFPAPRLERVEVAGHRSADPAAYLGLVGLELAAVPADPGTPLLVTLYWRDSEHPWSEAGFLNYLPRTRVVFGAGGFARVPAPLAARLDREAVGLPPLPPASAFPWANVSAVAGAASLIIVALVTLFRLRRRPLPGRQPTAA